jgi:pimeloyl-ACP methyl ester carboxylesterase
MAHRTDGIARFRSAQAERQYLAGYDEVIRNWPVPLEAIDAPTTFGTTRLYRTGAASGTPVVFLPGMGGNSLGWIYSSGPVGAKHPVYLVDPVGGAGRSVHTRRYSGVRDLTAWLTETLDAIDVPAAYLVGFSYGGWQSLLAAIHTPDRVLGMTLLDPAAFKTAGVRHLTWGLGCGIVGYLPKAVRPPLARLLHTDSLNRFEDLKAALAGLYLFEQALPPMVPLTDEELARVDRPTQMVFGAASTMHDSAAVARRLARVLPAAEVELVPNVGHSIALDVPDLVNQRILRHAASVVGA